MKVIQSAIESICRDLFNTDVSVILSRPDVQFGDFACNIALQLAGPVGKNPREIGEAIAGELKKRLPAALSEVSVAGPGFVNITVQDKVLLDSVVVHPESEEMSGKKVLTEYSDPNAMKPLHAGHLYTTLVGDMISRLVERSGAEVIRLNYGGDVGLHVARSMWAVLRYLDGENPQKLDEIPEEERPQWLGKCYAEGYAADEDDQQAHDEIVALNKRVYQIHAEQDHESPFAQIYWTCRDWSYDYFKVLYAQLQVKPFDRFIPESEVTERGLRTVNEQLKNDVYEQSDGAVVFKGEPFGLHTRVFINSNGLPTYECKDVGLLLTKWDDYHFDTSIVITANEQAQYYEVMLKSVEQFAPEPVNKSVHITHGVVKLQGGRKMSSRKGNVVSALEIIESAREAAREGGGTVHESTVLAAVKYALAKNKIGGDIVYDPKESIALEGNSGPYLQYAHARARSILRKAQEAAVMTEPQDLQPDERRLVRMLTMYVDAVEKATAELLPHHICTYLYELSQEFNRFYEKNRVIDDPRQAERLCLVNQYADVLKDGLELLGIEAMEQM